MGAYRDPTVVQPRVPAAQRGLSGRGPGDDSNPPSSGRCPQPVAVRWPDSDAATAGVPRLGRQILRPQTAVSLLLALAVVYLVARQGLGLEWPAIWARLQGAQAGLLLLALAVFYGSFVFRTLRWQVLLENVGYGRAAGQPLPSTTDLAKMVYLAWFANCVIVARLGDAYRAYLLKRATGVSFTVTLGTVLAERLLDLLTLVALISAAALAVFRGALPPEAKYALAAGLILSAGGVVGLFVLGRFAGTVYRMLPARVRPYYHRLEHGIVGSFDRMPLLIAYSTAGWIAEGAALNLTSAAVDAPVSLLGALMVALLGSLLTTVPLTPAGLGVADVGLVVALGWLGLDAEAAGAVALLTRLINYWSIVVFGSLLYLFSREGKRLRVTQDSGPPLKEEAAARKDGRPACGT